METLIEGYRRFRETGWPERRALFEKLAQEGQSPKAMVISCADSRADPAMIFDAGPGELFVVRNVAAIVPPFEPDGRYHGTSAALEYAVKVLQVPALVVLGHAMCGGVGALLRGVPDSTPDYLGPWVRIAAAARRRVLECAPADPQSMAEQEVVKLSLDNLLSFPWVDARVAEGKLKLYGAKFDIRTGALSLLQPDGSFAEA